MMQDVMPSVESRLTEWRNEPTVNDLRTDMLAAQGMQQQAASRIRHWREVMDVKGSARPPKVKGRSSVAPRLVRRQAEWRYTALSEPFLSSYRLFSVTPVSFEDVRAAQQNEALLNWQFQTKINRVQFIDRYVRACVDDGTAIVRVGWERQSKKVWRMEPIWQYLPLQNEEDVQALQQAVQLKSKNPREFYENASAAIKHAVEVVESSGQMYVPMQVGEQEVEREELMVNHPTVQVVDPLNVYIDPSCDGDMERALFVIYSFEASRSDLMRQQGRYSNLDKIDWNTVGAASGGFTGMHNATWTGSPAVQGENRRRGVVYEYWGYWDIHGTGELEPIVAAWIGQTMIRLEHNPFPDGKPPFVVVPYLPQRGSCWGEADAHVLEESQQIMGALTRGMVDLMGRSANAQHGFARGMLDPINRRRYEDGKDYEFMPEMNPLHGNLIEHKYPEIPASALHLLEMQNRDAEAMTGIKSFHGGLSGNAFGTLATGIRGMLDAAGRREMGILRRLALGMAEIGRKIASMNGTFLSDSEVVRVTNEEFVHISREDLEGNYDFSVDIATAEIDEAKAQDLGFMIQTIGPGMDWQLRNTILSQIARLKRMPDLAKAIEEWKPPQDEAKEQQAQLEYEKMRAEIELLNARAALVRTQAGMPQNKPATTEDNATAMMPPVTMSNPFGEMPQ